MFANCASLLATTHLRESLVLNLVEPPTLFTPRRAKKEFRSTRQISLPTIENSGMKALPAILVITVATLALAGDGPSRRNIPPAPEGGIVGRFQLVAATVDYSLGGPETPRHYLFRIDTATGQVWRYSRSPIAVNIPGHPELKSTEVDGWIETSEDFNESLKSVRSFSGEFDTKK